MSTLEQLDIRYHPVEDRLKLRLRLEHEKTIDLWLTRRFCQLLLEVLAQLARSQNQPDKIITPEARPELDQYNRAVATEDDHYGVAQQDGDNSPTHGIEPMLVSRIEHERLSGGLIRIGLGTHCGRTVHLNLNPKLIHSLTNLVLMGSGRAGWKLDQDRERGPAGEPQIAQRSLH